MEPPPFHGLAGLPWIQLALERLHLREPHSSLIAATLIPEAVGSRQITQQPLTPHGQRFGPRGQEVRCCFWHPEHPDNTFR